MKKEAISYVQLILILCAIGTMALMSISTINNTRCVTNSAGECINRYSESGSYLKDQQTFSAQGVEILAEEKLQTQKFDDTGLSNIGEAKANITNSDGTSAGSASIPAYSNNKEAYKDALGGEHGETGRLKTMPLKIQIVDKNNAVVYEYKNDNATTFEKYPVINNDSTVVVTRFE